MPSFINELESYLPKVHKHLADTLPAPAAEHSVLDGRVADFESIKGELKRYLYDMYADFSSVHGKRVRPYLAALGAQIAGAAPEEALSAGSAVETFQSAALIHDDIADESELRRGVPCLHIKEGTGLAINVGDLALTRTVELVLEAGFSDTITLRLIRELMDMERKTLEGQALDLGWSRDARWDITEDEYLYMAAHKTAYYSASTPLVLGAIIAGAADELIELLRSFGLLSGLAFQLQDDLLNVTGDAVSQGKDFRSDIVEGKRTLLVIRALRCADEDARKALVEILTKPEKSEAERDRVVEIMEHTGAITYVAKLAQELTREARSLLEDAYKQGLIDAWARECLSSMADFFVSRSS